MRPKECSAEGVLSIVHHTPLLVRERPPDGRTAAPPPTKGLCEVRQFSSSFPRPLCSILTSSLPIRVLSNGASSLRVPQLTTLPTLFSLRSLPAPRLALVAPYSTHLTNCKSAAFALASGLVEPRLVACGMGFFV